MDTTASLTAPCAPEALYPWVEDLSMYPQWTDLVHRVARASEEESAAGPAWNVELRGRLGPLARSKRLRMLRVVHDAAQAVTFERAELDGRRHARWSLAVTLTPEVPAGDLTQPLTRLDMHLHYDGTLWTGGLLEHALADQIERGRSRLINLAMGPRPSNGHPNADPVEG